MWQSLQYMCVCVYIYIYTHIIMLYILNLVLYVDCNRNRTGRQKTKPFLWSDLKLFLYFKSKISCSNVMRVSFYMRWQSVLCSSLNDWRELQTTFSPSHHSLRKWSNWDQESLGDLTWSCTGFPWQSETQYVGMCSLFQSAYRSCVET